LSSPISPPTAAPERSSRASAFRSPTARARGHRAERRRQVDADPRHRRPAARRAGTAAIEDDDGTWPTVAAASHYLGPANAMKPTLSVAENLSFWQAFAGRPERDVDEALETVGWNTRATCPFPICRPASAAASRLPDCCSTGARSGCSTSRPRASTASSEIHFAGLVSDHIAAGGIVVAATHLPIAVEGMKRLKFGPSRAAA
jgi:heme exporter protein A